ncbi:hypothetical protein [Pedobacter duraquae]|uniref:DUF4369 domain-containing protein n=1 Tax=Pedobacter duraquae TaxID=425511 RepID=A0A4R6IFG4_9SPHI|nr:hypothetical protein [Pedobacter duraquae]TDO20822.1 hypothetical protein CLV32_3456 [Pedobacter duraquae]
MKTRLILLFLMGPLWLTAQNINYVIDGQILDTTNARYAYLMTISYQVALSSDKVFQVEPVTDGKFEFKGNFDLAGRPYQEASIFFSRRGNISKEEIQSKYRNFVWPSRYDRVVKTITLDSMTLEVSSAINARDAKIVAGGKLAALYDAYALSSKNDYKDVLELIKHNPDSQATFDTINSLSGRFSYKDEIPTFWGTPLTLFPLLSERLRNSQAGKILKAKIDNDSKL